ncbi:iron complex outermembrane receptor protein [Chitinophaga polysaccharea]|uniref:Iron complex outermembrane receptor protein n=1 Tax=Chitinophaga polysaccharea TaxID=1293035 RepID=A0A561PH50_9BACT|nr:TonB-dependent receptor [Chitinophaga polysaccharea]TWF37415.1 iron complex outermembrane receptor protein [Chitinophaga polysaccharea]
MTKKILFLGITAIMATLQLAAQKIQGTVKDTAQTAIPMLRIYLAGTQKHALTNTNGSFTLNDVKPGTYQLLATGTGYKTLEQNITIQDSITTLHLTIQPSDVGLNEVVVTASRNKETLGTVPSSITIISGKQLREQSTITTDINQLLSMNVPGLTLGTNTSTNKGQTLRGRGMLIMIDGIPQSTPLRNGDKDIRSIDVSVIERVEVIKGSTAIYGNGADGGIINFITIKANTNQRFSGSTDISGNGSLTHPSGSLGGRISQNFTGKINKFDYVVSGTYEKTGVNKDANGEVIAPFQSLSQNKNVNAFAKLGYDINTDNRVEVMYNYYRSMQYSTYVNNGGKFGVSPIIGIPGTSPGDRQGTPYNHNAALNYTNKNIFKNTSLGVNLYYQDFYTVFEYSDFYAPPGNSAISSRKMGARVNFNTIFNFHPNLFGDVTWGVDILNDKTSQPLTDGRSFVPEMNMKNYAPYAQLKTYLFKDFLLKAGVRYENISLHIPDYTTIKFGNYAGGVFVKGGNLPYEALVFNAGLRYTKFPAFNPFVSYSQSFSLYDLGRTLRLAKAVSNGTTSINTIETKAIITNNYEAGFNSSIGKFNASGSYFISTSSLGTSLKDVNGVAVPERAPERVEGFELTAGYQFLPNLSANTAYAHVEGKKDVNGIHTYLPTTRISPDKLTVNVSYSPLKSWDLGVYYIYSGIRKRFDPNPNTKEYDLGNGPVSDFYLVNFYTGYRFNKNMSVRLGVDNLLNADYYPVMSQARVRTDSYIKGSGARMNIGFKYGF